MQERLVEVADVVVEDESFSRRASDDGALVDGDPRCAKQPPVAQGQRRQLQREGDRH